MLTIYEQGSTLNGIPVTVRSLIFEGLEELMPYSVRFEGDCGSDGGDTV